MRVFILLVSVLLLCNSSAGAAVPGDIDGNQSLDLGDVIAGLQIVSGGDPEIPGVDANPSADIDLDGRIGGVEVTYNMQVLAEVREEKSQPSAGFLFFSGLFGLIGFRKRMRRSLHNQES